jgi:hypothetical protein
MYRPGRVPPDGADKERDRKKTMIDDARRCFPEMRVPVVDGDFKLVYEPEPARPNSWMVNDHCLIRDMDGNVHFFGIENPYPSTRQALAELKKLAGGSGSSLSEVIMDDALVPTADVHPAVTYKVTSRIKRVSRAWSTTPGLRKEGDRNE